MGTRKVAMRFQPLGPLILGDVIKNNYFSLL
jgi:hypothetical protein